MVPRFVYFSCS